MNRNDGLERRLSVWMSETAAPRVPEYTNDILRSTAGRRQRPRWTFPERWLPMSVQVLERVPATPIPWRTLGLLGVIGLLTAALLAVMVGVGGPRVPEPFGLAGNGLVAYADHGDIFTVDPATGARVSVVTGPETDHDPRWSLDGTRLAFLRSVVPSRGYAQVVAIDSDAARPRVIASEPLIEVDSDSVRWAPDGGSIVVVHGAPGLRRISLVDTDDGTITDLEVGAFEGLEVFWRPPAGRQLLFVSLDGGQRGLSIVSIADGSIREVPVPAEDREQLRAMGWTADGTRVVAHHLSPSTGLPQTSIIDPETGDATVLDVAYGHVSNDGTRVAGLSTRGRPVVCVVDISGGPCTGISESSQAPDGSHGEGLQWSPDDEWVVVQPFDSPEPVLLDPDFEGSAPGGGWVADGAESWQRTVP